MFVDKGLCKCVSVGERIMSAGLSILRPTFLLSWVFKRRRDFFFFFFESRGVAVKMGGGVNSAILM